MLEKNRRLDAVGGSPRWVYWVVLVLCTGLGAGLATAALVMLARQGTVGAWGPLASVGALVGGLAWLAVTATFYRNYLHVPVPDPRRVTVETVGGEPAVVVAWRRTFHWQPFFVSVVVTLAAAFLAFAFLRVGHWAWWVPVIVVLPVLLALPDRFVELARPLRLVLTPLGIGATTLDGDAWLDWADVRSVSVERDNQWFVVRVAAVSRPESWYFRRRAKVLSVPALDAPCIEIPGPAVPVDPQRLIDALEHYRSTPAARDELVGEAGRRRVTG